jgi:hypothetical protein
MGTRSGQSSENQETGSLGPIAGAGAIPVEDDAEWEAFLQGPESPDITVFLPIPDDTSLYSSMPTQIEQPGIMGEHLPEVGISIDPSGGTGLPLQPTAVETGSGVRPNT